MELKKSLHIAKEVLDNEVASLILLRNSLNNEFNIIIDRITQCSGRIVLTGIGKSSFIAKKISSTLSSTGTPSFFIHPTEASHGDLGMLKKDDILVALSRSGESLELIDTLEYCSNAAIPIIGITNKVNSTLYKFSDYKLLLPDVEEACNLGLAPTTTALMMLAIGDAISISTCNKKNFTKENFKTLHPGGKIGKNLQKVFDVMHSADELPIITQDSTLHEAIIEMSRCRFGCVGIVNLKGKLKGIFTDGDLRRNLISVNLWSPIIDLCSYAPVMINQNEYVTEVIKTFKDNKIPSAFVCEDEKPIGIIHIHDLLKGGQYA